MKKIVINSTGTERDTFLNLPVAGFLKEKVPGCEIYFIAHEHSRFLVASSKLVDGFVSVRNVLAELKDIVPDVIIFLNKDKQIAKAAKNAAVPLRICEKSSVTDRLYYNKRLVLDKTETTSLRSLAFVAKALELDFECKVQLEWLGMEEPVSSRMKYRGIIKKTLYNVVLYPFAKGEDKIWPLVKYLELVESLPKHQFNFIVVGSEWEGNLLKQYLPELFRQPNVKDMTGMESLQEAMDLIVHADTLISFNSLLAHWTSTLGKSTLMVTAPAELPYYQPLNPDIKLLVIDNIGCNTCTQKKACACIKQVEVDIVKQALLEEMEKVKGAEE
ncbi:glycosyltransferase family 9 protein [Limibacter armeniacum]|uniref:glycosyltransferase family 9 protein n=1 Tax=Limibacter armeniacum TaxID=466084 RepID=UPI002FE5CE7C